MKNRIFKKSTALLVMMITIPAALWALSGSEILENFRKRMYRIQSASGIIQWNSEDGMTYTGNFKYMNPGKIYIKFSSPHNKIIVSNGKKLWIYDPGNNICGVQDLNVGTVSGGIAGLVKDYFALVTSQGSEGYTLKLKNNEKAFEEILLKLDSSFMLQRAILKTKEGQTIHFSLSNIDTNANIIKNIFDFNVPANTQIINNPMNIR